MKLFIVSIYCVILPFHLFAQIILNNDIAPSQNTFLDYTLASSVDGIDINATGTNNFWDFSSLNALEVQNESYLNVFSVPFSYYPTFTNPIFPPVATTARDISEVFSFPAPGITIEEAYAFYYKSEDVFTDMGFAILLNSIPITARYNQAELLLKFPLEFNSTWSSQSSASVNIPTLGYWQQDRQRTAHVEASGTLLLPFGTELDVLKVKSVVLVQDSFFNAVVGFPFTPPLREEIYYQWFAEGYIMPVVEVFAIGQQGGIEEQINTIRYQSDYFNSTFDISNDELAFEIFFNNKRLIISFEKPIIHATASIIDLNGRLINNITLSGSDRFYISTPQLPAGIYFLSISQNNKISARQFIVID